MRPACLITLILFSIHCSPAQAYVSVACGRTSTNPIVCVLAEVKGSDSGTTSEDAVKKCLAAGISDCRWFAGYSGACHGIAATLDGRTREAFGGTVDQARITAFQSCNATYHVQSCHSIISFCDNVPYGSNNTIPVLPPGTSNPSTPNNSSTTFIPSAPSNRPALYIPPDQDTVEPAIKIGFAGLLIFSLLAAWKPLLNLFVHGRLPYELPVYGEDIQCLIKRTQRVNWYGRVVFGLVVNLSMTQAQLLSVRKYWLGRVIVFDSLRRQRQNKLAALHLQLAKSIRSPPQDRTTTAKIVAFIVTIVLMAFFLLRAIFSLLFGFLFLRVNISKMIRGTVVESNNLALIFEAKDAIEEGTANLKEYITMADTFDGRDDIYGP